MIKLRQLFKLYRSKLQKKLRDIPDHCLLNVPFFIPFADCCPYHTDCILFFQIFHLVKMPAESFKKS